MTFRICFILQDDTDEIFDPSALIDIEKFRAVNAPTKQVGYYIFFSMYL